MKPSNKKQHTDWWRHGIVVILALATSAIGYPTRAVLPEQARIDEILGNSSELVIRRSGRTRESVQPDSVLQRIRDVLITAPPNNAYALLRFLSGNGRDLNFYVQTNPHPEPAIYYFPCQLQGGEHHIGWGLARDESRGCETGLELKRGRSDHAQNSSLLIAGRSLKQLAQAPVRQIYYCSVVGPSGNMGFATTSSGDPCSEALQQCQISDSSACEISARGFWWTSDEQLHATIECLASPGLSMGESEDGLVNEPAEQGEIGLAEGSVSVVLDESSNQALLQVTGTGETIAADIQTVLQQVQGQSCRLQVHRPQDFTISPAPDDVVLALGDDETLVHAQDTAMGLQVDVLKGAINVRSINHPGSQLVTKGQRYRHSGSSSEITTFDRTEALTSVEMEVLCAFAYSEESNLNVSACSEANLVPASGQPPIAFCDREQASGGREGDRRTLQMGTNQGEIRLDYEMFSVPDRFQIIYEGREILNTGFISGSDSLSVPFSGKSGRVDVIVTGNQATQTRWNYTLRCPR